MKIRLRYGAGDLSFAVPDANVAGVYRPIPPEVPESGSHLAALAATPEAERLREESRGRSALFFVADATRDEPHADILETGLAYLVEAREVVVVVATGSHRADTPGNCEIAAAAVGAASRLRMPRPRVVVHDCRRAAFTDHGVTSRGNRILLSSVLDDAELCLISSDVKHHWFAGYSNPLKYFLPGIAAFESIERNHRLALEPDSTFGRHPFHPDPARRTNPVAEDMLEASERGLDHRPSWALVTVKVEERIVHAALGPLSGVTAEAMDRVDRVATFSVDESTRVVVSAGGSPEDDTLYLSHRAVELTRAAVSEGAEILLLAECAGGIADGRAAYENFYAELTRPPDEVLRRIRDGYRLYQHKAFKFAELLSRVGSFHLRSALPDDDVRAAHLIPVPDAQSVVDAWVREDPACRIAFFDEANRLCVLPK
jgi:nickel-dependent lactate racemase